ncbi:MAG: OB-fold nucleic acid binding domain-containing protein [Candidatus ainarchaeum sp.]|nr:OB-fold nucleic acid binding domain-containing protein [Candidatus ainarchaeum sp.]
MEDENSLVSEISKKTGKTVEEINKLIEKKEKKFSGLLSKQGAIFMIQKELGLKQNINAEIKINEIKDGMKDFEIIGIIKNIYPLKEFEKNGKKGKLLSFLIEDETGLVRLTLWNDQIEKYDLTQGSKIKIINGFATSYNEKKQLSLGFNGNIEIINKKEEEFEKISELKTGLNNVNVVGRLLRKFPHKEFENEEKKGKVCNFQFGDETALLKATAWNEKVEEIQKFAEGQAIEIINGYTKEGMYGIELHAGYNSIIRESKKELPKIIEILKENIKEKKINELVENENFIINGSIKEIQLGKIYFNACEKCGKKIEGNICENCGEIKGEKKAVLNVLISDESAEIRATFFGNIALNLIGWTKEDLDKETNEKSNEKIIEELNEKLNKKEIKLFGYAKENSFSNQTEFNVKEIV